MNNTEYWEEIKDIAENIVDEAMDEAKQDYDGNNPDFNELKEIAEESINDYRLHEVIDGHQWVIYYGYNMDVIKHSNNDSYYADNFGAESLAASLEQGGLDALHCHIAFWAMYADVSEYLDTAFDDYEANMDEDA